MRGRHREYQVHQLLRSSKSPPVLVFPPLFIRNFLEQLPNLHGTVTLGFWLHPWLVQLCGYRLRGAENNSFDATGRDVHNFLTIMAGAYSVLNGDRNCISGSVQDRDKFQPLSYRSVSIYACRCALDYR